MRGHQKSNQRSSSCFPQPGPPLPQPPPSSPPQQPPHHHLRQAACCLRDPLSPPALLICPTAPSSFRLLWQSSRKKRRSKRRDVGMLHFPLTSPHTHTPPFNPHQKQMLQPLHHLPRQGTRATLYSLSQHPLSMQALGHCPPCRPAHRLSRRQVVTLLSLVPLFTPRCQALAPCMALPGCSPVPATRASGQQGEKVGCQA
ncbi:hypothetical protein V8C86DRAFT_2547315 [Haematococcus lacustris]